MKNIFVIILILLFCGCKEEIVHGVGEGDANRIVTHLNDSGIAAEKKVEPTGNWSISVDNENSIRAIKIITASRIIRDGDFGEDNKSSLVASREEQKFKHERGLSKEIEKTLLNIPQVLEARVHLNRAVTDPILGRPVGEDQGSASVLLLVDAGREVPRGEIANLIAGASGIPSTKISVIVAEEPRDLTPSTPEMLKAAPDFNQADVTNLSVSLSTRQASFLKLERDSTLLVGMGAASALALLFFIFFLRKLSWKRKLRQAI